MVNEFDLEEEYLNDYSNATNSKTVKRLFETQTTLAKKVKLPDPEEIIVNLDKNMDLVPGTIDLILVESDKDGTKAKKVKSFIQKNNLRDLYDFIFIDCPATISVYTNAALIASDYYLVPNRIDRYSILGIKLLKEAIDRIDDNESIGIKPVGIVYTMLDSLENPSRKTQLLKDTFEKNEIVKEMGLLKY